MDCITILAETVKTASRVPQATEQSIVPVDFIWQQVTSLNLLEAMTFISFGAVCLLYGWRVFKILVVIGFGLLGLVLGMTISGKISGSNNQLIGGLIGLGLAAAISVPLMRWAVSILGAVAGGILTSGLWYASGLPEQYIWAGGLIGVVAGGMISFIIFRIAVMLFSSLAGSGLIASGALALLYIYPQTTEQIQQLFFGSKWFLPVLLLVPTAVGVIVQNKFIKGSASWSV